MRHLSTRVLEVKLRSLPLMTPSSIAKKKSLMHLSWSSSLLIMAQTSMRPLITSWFKPRVRQTYRCRRSYPTNHSQKQLTATWAEASRSLNRTIKSSQTCMRKRIHLQTPRPNGKLRINSPALKSSPRPFILRSKRSLSFHCSSHPSTDHSTWLKKLSMNIHQSVWLQWRCVNLFLPKPKKWS